MCIILRHSKINSIPEKRAFLHKLYSQVKSWRVQLARKDLIHSGKQINRACLKELTSGWAKTLNFQRSLNWIKFFLCDTVYPKIQNIAKHWFFQNILFENVMGISILFISLKRTFFKIKRNPCLGGCKKEYKLSNHWWNTQIM